MNTLAAPLPLTENLCRLAYPLKIPGADLRRNVTLIRLQSGKVVIHSTAAFTPADVAAIRALGEPGWLWGTPGKPTHSRALQRMSSREPKEQMPPLATSRVDEAAVALLKRWIEELPATKAVNQ